MEKRIAKGTFLHDLPDFVEKLRISHLPVMRLLGIFSSDSPLSSSKDSANLLDNTS